MNNPPVENTALQTALKEHQDLMRLLGRLNAAVTAAEVDRGALAQQLRDLRAHMTEHFALEDQGGYFEEVVEFQPHLRERVDELHDQHPLLAAGIAELIDIVEGDPADEGWTASLKARFETFRTLFVEHEHGENELVQEAYEQDIGSKD